MTPRRAGMYAFAVTALMVLAGCGEARVARRQPVYREHLRESPLPSTTPSGPSAGMQSPYWQSPEVKPTAPPRWPGHFVFTVPANVTRVDTTNDTGHIYLLYYGRPLATDLPFVTVDVSPDAKAITAHNKAFRVKSFREFILNGLVAQQWTGYTARKNPFCELLVKHGTHRLHALAIARTRAARKTALAILGSVRWKHAANAGNNAGTAPTTSTP